MLNAANKENKGGYIIYVDTGGTFSDCMIIKPDGTFVSGKSRTTPHDLSQSFLGAIEMATSEIGESVDEILRHTIVLGYGTTEGTNIVVSGTGASRLDRKS